MTELAAWVLDPAHTHIGFSVSHLGLTRTPGVFKRFAAQLRFNDQNVEASSVKFEVETASIDTALEMRDEHLRRADWFDVDAHPNAIFVSHTVRRGDEDRYVIDGELSLRGVTLPVRFDATLTGRAINPWTQMPVIGFEAVATISRSAYGMDAFPAALSDGVRLKIGTELTVANDANQ
ncbi:YceI family protein [Paraburkholderia sp. MM5384-R2]|uniref:YceI family protein n=1 Tax=Paraburkholderia sp. MM5384-R2 TaxID=2723097 RepID=UPI00160EB9AC|nr:YceI family protein [Paraburkholderia sp. MM5384-R2]MBB5497603.1 polyisoprenoid-binding protein YceI [Paraburkholderia sp. MM5384-R2]